MNKFGLGRLESSVRIIFTLFAVFYGCSLLPCLALEASMPENPANWISEERPEFNWTSASNATWYYVWINRDGQTYYRTWIQNETSWTPWWNLPAGTYEWWVQTWNESEGYGPWSSAKTFYIASKVPGTTSPLSPKSTISSYRPTFQWQSVSNATWYYVWLDRDGSSYYSKWIQSEAYWTPPWDLDLGNYTWWVRTWNKDGYGSWSAPEYFQIWTAIPINLSCSHDVSGVWLMENKPADLQITQSGCQLSGTIGDLTGSEFEGWTCRLSGYVSGSIIALDEMFYHPTDPSQDIIVYKWGEIHGSYMVLYADNGPHPGTQYWYLR